MECDLVSLHTENCEEDMKTLNKGNERLQEPKPDDICSNLGTKPSASECRSDDSVMPNSKIISIRKSEEDFVITENQTSTSAVDSGKLSAITISDNKPPLKGSRLKPGVILLGRGNSFSLGRSEVILLHNRPVSKRKSRDDGQRSSKENDLDSIQEQSKTPPSPPPISEKDVSSRMNAHTNGWHRREKDTLIEELESVSDDGDTNSDTITKSLHELWCKAEEVMASSKGQVLKVLEEFGIGELEGGGGEDGGEGKQEEEQVWQIVQENYRSQR